MKFVVDTNVLMTFFWKQSAFKKILDKGIIDCISPEYALEEINKYQKHIQKKTSIDEKTFQELKEELAVYVHFIDDTTYKQALKQALRISPDPDDIDFFALAITEKTPLWSNDKKLKEQEILQVLNTKEIIDIIAQQDR